MMYMHSKHYNLYCKIIENHHYNDLLKKRIQIVADTFRENDENRKYLVNFYIDRFEGSTDLYLLDKHSVYKNSEDVINEMFETNDFEVLSAFIKCILKNSSINSHDFYLKIQSNNRDILKYIFKSIRENPIDAENMEKFNNGEFWYFVKYFQIMF